MPKPRVRAERTDLSSFMSQAARNPTAKPLNFLLLASEWYEDVVNDGRDRAALYKICGMRVKLATLLAPSYIRSALPRDLPWTRFPVVSDPWFVFKPVCPQSYQAIPRLQFGDVGIPLEMVDIFPAYDAYGIELRRSRQDPLAFCSTLFRIATLIDKFGDPAAPVFLKIIDGAEEGNLDGEWTRVDIAEILTAHHAYASFLYSYDLNFRAMTTRALRAATDWKEFDRKQGLIREDDGPWDGVWNTARAALEAGAAFRAGHHPTALSNPLTLQFLYKLRRVGGTTLVQSGKHAYLLDGLYHKMEDGKTIAWEGSGKHPPLATSSVSGSTLAGCGLLDVDFQTGIVTLSAAGERFLDILHPDCEDPDVLLRWLDPETGFVRPDAARSMDDWVMKHFLKMKPRLNDIPADRIKLPEPLPRGNGMWIRDLAVEFNEAEGKYYGETD